MLRMAVLAVSLALLAPQVVLAQSIEGVWRMVEVEVQGGPNPQVFTGAQIQPSLFILTEGHFAYLIDNSAEPRPALQDPTDAQIVESIAPLAFAAGTYQFDGSTLRYVRMTAINPNQVLPENQPQVRQVERVTANRLETSATNANGVKTILKYNRVE